MRLPPRITRSAPLLLAGMLVAASAQAQTTRVQIGVHGNVSDDADLGAGADVRWPFLRSDNRLALVGSFDYFFPQDEDVEFGNEDLRGLLGSLLAGFPGAPADLPLLPLLPNLDVETDRTYWEANLDLTYDLGRSGAVIPYAGVGLNYAHSHVEVLGFEDDSHDFGANVLAGVRIARRVFVQAKREAGGGELFVLTAGVRF